MTDTIIVQTPAPTMEAEAPLSPSPLIDAETGEVIEEEIPEHPAVEIARIEADRDITLAAIQGDTAVQVIEAESARSSEEELTWLREQVTNLQGQVQGMTEALALLTPQPLAEPEPLIVATDLTPPSISPETVETLTEAIEESEPVKEAEPVRRKRRAI